MCNFYKKYLKNLKEIRETMFKSTTIDIIKYLQAHDGEDLTADDVANGLGLGENGARSVNGAFTSLQKKHLGVRTPASIQNDDGTYKNIKLLSLTDAGKNFDPVAANEAEAAAKAAKAEAKAKAKAAE